MSGDHSHEVKNFNKIFFIGIFLNLSFVLVEAFFGYLSNSLALIADAGHNLSDVAGLFLTWTAFWLSKRKASINFTFGFRKSSIISALFNAIILMIALGIIIWEAIHRLNSPLIVQTSTMMIVSGIGIVINSLTAYLFMKDREKDINLKGAYMHMVADAMISVGVVISALVISFTSWFWLDPVISIVIALVIIMGTWKLLTTSIRMSLDGVPVNISSKEVLSFLVGVSGVKGVHDLHIWGMSTTEAALSVHLVVKSNINRNKLLTYLAEELHDRFEIEHPTIQFEDEDLNFKCKLNPVEIV